MNRAGERVAVIGAGLSGLTAARALADSGRSVELFEKARGVGGRMSTRRAEPWSFDHGAQYFTVREPGFAQAVAAWRRERLVAPWTGHVIDLQQGSIKPRRDRETRYVAKPGMNAICKWLAEGLALHTQTRITDLERVESGWLLADAENETHGPFGTVMISAPPAQAAALLDSAPQLQAVASSVSMEPCWAVMAAFAMTVGVHFDAAFVSGSPLAWVCCEDAKPRRHRGEGEAWVLHATPEWSRAQIDASQAEVAEQLVEAFRMAARVTLPRTTHVAAHRWLYARVTRPVGQPCLWDERLRLGVCGDWFLGGRVEAAYSSGTALARAALPAAASA